VVGASVFAVATKLLTLALVVTAVAQIRFPARVTPVGGSGTLMEAADLSCAGVFKTPDMATGAYSVSMPVAFKGHDGTRRVYLVYDGQGNVRELNEPTLSSCATSIASMNVATSPAWGGNWGAFTVNALDGYIPGGGGGSTFAFDLHYDATTSRLVLGWGSTYSGSTPGNTFATGTLNSGDHTISTTGCYYMSQYSDKWMSSGILTIPDAFVTAYLPAGARWAVGKGGYFSSQGNSMGPALAAIVPPSTNACASNTNYELASSTLLESHAQNSTGPNCMSSTINGPGCTPGTSPTTPYPARMLFDDYSYDLYAFTWEPSGARGWWSFTGGPLAWYDDGVKYGVVAPITTSSGWLNTTVSASPAPTYNTGTFIGELTVPTLDMHDGSNLNPGDAFWVQTCVVGTHTGCADENGNKLTIAIVDSVDTGTKRITYHAFSSGSGVDPSNSNHTPIVGGVVWAGVVYAHGSPGSSRSTARLQIYNPAQYAEVVATTRESYEVEYAEEIDATTLFSHFGSPATGSGIRGTMAAPESYSRSPSSVIADPDRNQIIVFWTGATNGIGVQQSMAYVLDVSQAAPAPSPFPIVPLAAGAAVWVTGALTSGRSRRKDKGRMA
jgi:hypothetical protein